MSDTSFSSQSRPQPLPLPRPGAYADGGASVDTYHPECLPSIDNAPKRLRRPSVRLGDTVVYTACSASIRRRSKNLKDEKDSVTNAANDSYKTRSLADLELRRPRDDMSGVGDDRNVQSLNSARRAETREKMRRLGGPIARLVKTNWFSNFEEETAMNVLRSKGREDIGDVGNDGSDGMVREQSFSPQRGHSKARISKNRDVKIEFHDTPSENEGGDWGVERNRRILAEEEVEEGSVRGWLEGLGLGRYTPVFDFHEVDEKVLPLLTLEDLKDMGINAVGPRRKMYSAIQKLGKRFI